HLVGVVALARGHPVQVIVIGVPQRPVRGRVLTQAALDALFAGRQAVPPIEPVLRDPVGAAVAGVARQLRQVAVADHAAIVHAGAGLHQVTGRRTGRRRPVGVVGADPGAGDPAQAVVDRAVERVGRGHRIGRAAGGLHAVWSPALVVIIERGPVV